MARSYILAFLMLFMIAAGGFLAFKNKPAMMGYYDKAMASIKPAPALPAIDKEVVTIDTQEPPPSPIADKSEPIILDDPARRSGLERVNDTLASIVERLDAIENRIDDLKNRNKRTEI